MRSTYVNPSSVAGTIVGADGHRTLAATKMAQLLNAEEPSCFLFTSGATESNNWVLGPIVRRFARKTILITAAEHPSISEPAEFLQSQGFRVVVIPLERTGRVDLRVLERSLTDDVALVSVIAANNEIGIIQPLGEIGDIIRHKAPTAFFHTDATQAVGKIPINLCQNWSHVDLLSFSGHKFHGPKGVGGLYIRPGIELAPMHLGGGQEMGFRSGTANTPALAGLAKAAELASSTDQIGIRSLRDGFEEMLTDRVPNVVIHSSHEDRLPNTSCFSIPGSSPEDVVVRLASAGIIIGTGAACSSGSMKPPKTLIAMGVPYELANSSLRISLSKWTTESELTAAVQMLAQR